LGSRLMAEMQGNLQSQALGAQQGYANQLLNLQAQNRDAFIRGEFSFMNQMDYSFQQQQFQKELLNMQASLQRDAQSRANMFALAGSIGGFLALGPVGSAVGGWIGDQFGGGYSSAPQQYGYTPGYGMG
jgi:hypothetical protein